MKRYVGSVGNLTAVAGALAAPGLDLVVTSNRGEHTVALFSPDDRAAVDRIGVGVRPNGLAYDPRRARLLVAHVGAPAIPASTTVSIVDVHARKRIVDVPVAGRTRWTVYDPVADAFHVNIADPPQIVVIGASDPVGVRRIAPIAHAGPHGLDIDVVRRRLFCTCDAGVLLEIDADRGTILDAETITGIPDVVFHDAALDCLYVAIGDPGVIEVFDTRPFRRHETIPTEFGAHTLSFDAARHVVFAFLPASHRARGVRGSSSLGVRPREGLFRCNGRGRRNFKSFEPARIANNSDRCKSGQRSGDEGMLGSEGRHTGSFSSIPGVVVGSRHVSRPDYRPRATVRLRK